MLVNGVRRLQKEARAEDPVPPGATHSRCSEMPAASLCAWSPAARRRPWGKGTHTSLRSERCPQSANRLPSARPADPGAQPGTPPRPPCDVTPFLLHPTCISAPTTRAGPLECPPSWDHTGILGRGGRELRNPLMAPPPPLSGKGTWNLRTRNDSFEVPREGSCKVKVRDGNFRLSRPALGSTLGPALLSEDPAVARPPGVTVMVGGIGPRR